MNEKGECSTYARTVITLKRPVFLITLELFIFILNLISLSPNMCTLI